MREGFYHIESTARVSLAIGGFSSQPERMTASHFRAAIGWLPIVVIVGIGTGFVNVNASKDKCSLLAASHI